MNGIYLIASGEKYFEEATQVIRRLKCVMPNTPIALCTDRKESIEVDYLIQLENPLYNFADKVRYFKNTPFENTIFLDTDIYVVKDITEMFTLLNRFEVAAPHAPIEMDELVDLPCSFAEPNSGVIVYKKNINVINMFSEYEKHYMNALDFYMRKGDNIPPDQPSFRYALYRTNVNFTFLPHEFNCMVDYPCFLSGEVYILHGHYTSRIMQLKEQLINRYTGIRIYDPQKGISIFHEE